MSIFPYNEYVLCATSLVYGLWIVYYSFVLPPNAVRPIFAVMFVVPGLLLLAVLVPPLKTWLEGRTWGGKPAHIQARWCIYMYFVSAWLLIALAITLSTTTRAIHAVPYVALALFCAGKTLRLAYYDR